MPYINKVKFGEIIIDGKKYSQVLIIGEAVLERDVSKLNKIYGSTHEIADWEVEQLFSNKPNIIVIGTGWQGMLKIKEDLVSRAELEGVELYVDFTPDIIKRYNEARELNKKINALIHTTC